MIDPILTAVERAFELAKSGQLTSLEDLKKKLSDEGYDACQIEGSALASQLKKLIKIAQRIRPAKS